MIPDFFENTIIVTGHYGSGKTNLSLNMALALRKAGKEVALADLDIVNPYFRSADFAGVAKETGIRLITPAYAGSGVDIPALTGELDARLGGGGATIIDVGGDADGAFALGRYAPRISQNPYTMLYVVNAYRYLTREPQEAVGLLREIEQASRLCVTHIVNNSNLAGDTTAQIIQDSAPYAAQVSELTGKPLAFTVVERALIKSLDREGVYFPVGRYVLPPW